MKKLPDKYKMPRMSYSYDEVPEGMYPYSEKDQQQDTTAQIYNSIVDAFNKKLELIYRDIKD